MKKSKKKEKKRLRILPSQLIIDNRWFFKTGCRKNRADQEKSVE